MKKIKKTLRLLAFIVLIVLAGLGIGISGGVPIPLSNHRKKSEKENIELMENQEESSTFQESQIKG